jgi:hypothetical protein
MPGRDRQFWYIPGSEYASPSPEEDGFSTDYSSGSTTSSEVSLWVPCGPKELGFVIYDAYLHVARIYNPSFNPDFHDMDPWDELGEALKELRRHGDDAWEFWQMLSEYTYTSTARRL